MDKKFIEKDLYNFAKMLRSYEPIIFTDDKWQDLNEEYSTKQLINLFLKGLSSTPPLEEKQTEYCDCGFVGGKVGWNENTGTYCLSCGKSLKVI